MSERTIAVPEDAILNTVEALAYFYINCIPLRASPQDREHVIDLTRLWREDLKDLIRSLIEEALNDKVFRANLIAHMEKSELPDVAEHGADLLIDLFERNIE